MKDENPRAKNPLILRYHRLLEAFSKSDDERDFYLDRVEDNKDIFAESEYFKLFNN